MQPYDWHCNECGQEWGIDIYDDQPCPKCGSILICTVAEARQAEANNVHDAELEDRRLGL